MGPQGAMGLYVIVVFAGHTLYKSVGPQCAMGLSVDVVFAGHILFNSMWVIKAPRGCLFLWYLLIIGFKNL